MAGRNGGLRLTARTKAEIEAERAEVLRQARVLNYATKRAANWRCQTCGADRPGNLVVFVEDRRELRCPEHRDGLQVCAGQMDEIEKAKAEARE